MTPGPFVAILDNANRPYGAKMIPIHGERGKLYYAIQCSNAECREALNLIELPHHYSWEQGNALQEQVRDLTVRCPVCTRETRIREQQFIVHEVR
jgi:hypothetical protein